MKTKKALRLKSMKVPRAAAMAKTMATMGGDVARFNTFVDSQVIKAREEGIKLGAGIDAAATLQALVVESNEARALLRRISDLAAIDGPLREQVDCEAFDTATFDIAAFLLKPRPPFVMRAPTADAPAAPPEAPSADLAATPCDAPPADAAPAASAP